MGVDHLGDVAQAEPGARCGGDNHALDVFQGSKLTHDPDGVGPGTVCHRAAGQVQVVALEHGGRVVHGAAVAGQGDGLEADLDFPVPAAVDADGRHGGDALQERHHYTFYEGLHLVRIIRPRHTDGHDGHLRRVELEHPGIPGTVGQEAPHHVDGFPHVQGGLVDVDAPVELDDHQ